MPKIYSSDTQGHNFHFVVVCSRFNETVVKALLEGALAELKKYSVAEDKIEVAWVPGAFELPLAAMKAAARKEVSAVICLGAVIRGGTPHFEYVCQAAATGILKASMDTHTPISFGVLTTDTVEQAFDRAGGKLGNKGNEAALAALEMANLLPKLGGNA